MLYKEKSCALNGGFTTNYFNLEKGISVYLFILALEILFLLIKKNIFFTCFSLCDICRWFNVLPHRFCLKDLASAKKLIDVFSYYLKYSGLKPNFSKCKITAIASLKGFEVAACGIK